MLRARTPASKIGSLCHCIGVTLRGAPHPRDECQDREEAGVDVPRIRLQPAGGCSQASQQQPVQRREAQEELVAGDRDRAADVLEAERPDDEGAAAEAGGVAHLPVPRGQGSQGELETCRWKGRIFQAGTAKEAGYCFIMQNALHSL